MNGLITFETYGYGFGDAMIQTSPEKPPEPGKIIRFVGSEGLEVRIPFADAEQWAEFQRQVAAEEMPSAVKIELPSTTDVRHVNGSKLH